VTKTQRIIISLVVMLLLTAVIQRVAAVVGSIIWLVLLFTGVVNDVGGPVWATWLCYAPTVLGYLAIGALCARWVRSGPNK